MSLKDNLMGFIREVMELRTRTQEEIREIQRDERYTQEHKDQLVQKAKEAFAANADTIAVNARGQIDKARKGFQQSQDSTAKNRLSPDRAQAFRTAIQMIELAGKALSAGDLRELAEPFAEDPIAMAAIRGLVDRNGLDGEQLPFVPSSNPDGPLDTAWGIINSAASKPLDQDVSMSAAVGLSLIEQMPASVFEVVSA